MMSICLILAIAGLAAADTIHPYGVSSPGVFSMSIAGGWTGNGLSVLSFDGRVLDPATSRVAIGAGFQSTSASHETIPGNTASAQAIANIGIFKLGASYSDATGGFHNHTAAIVDVGWLDLYTISDPLYNGQNGVLTFVMHADGEISGAGAGQWQLGASTSFAINFSAVESGCDVRFPGSSPCPLTVNSDYAVSVPFVFGTSFEMMIRSFAVAGLPSIGDSSPPNTGTDIGFLNTIYWAGIQSVKVGGQAINSYSISAASGADYTQSFAPVSEVPEPEAFWMLAIGLAGLGSAARARCP